MELNENYDAETWLAEWWPIVMANFRAIKNAYDDLDDDIAEEKLRREQLDVRHTSWLEAFGYIISLSDNDDGVYDATDAEGLLSIRTESIFRLRNNTSGTITALQLSPDIWTLSKPVMKDQEVICLLSNQTGELKRKIIVFNEDMASLADIDSEATTRANADNEIANGTRTITPNLAPGTKQNGNDISKGLEFLGFVDYGNNTPSNPPTHILPTHYLDGDMFFYTPSDYGGYSTLADMAARINTNISRITAIEGNMPTSATAAEIREAWNPTPVTPTVTISGAYDADSETLVISAEDMAKLEALNVQELFDLVINATGVEYSGAAKTITTITTSLTQEEPIYEFRSSIPLWDTEYSYNRFNDCYIISHYDSPDAGEIGGGQW